MLNKTRMRDLRKATGLRAEEFAFLVEVGVATIHRWESKGRSTLPTGLPRRVYEVLDRLDAAGTDLTHVAENLRRKGNIETIRLLLNRAHDLQEAP